MPRPRHSGVMMAYPSNREELRDMMADAILNALIDMRFAGAGEHWRTEMIWAAKAVLIELSKSNLAIVPMEPTAGMLGAGYRRVRSLDIWFPDISGGLASISEDMVAASPYVEEVPK